MFEYICSNGHYMTSADGELKHCPFPPCQVDLRFRHRKDHSGFAAGKIQTHGVESWFAGDGKCVEISIPRYAPVQGVHPSEWEDLTKAPTTATESPIASEVTTSERWGIVFRSLSDKEKQYVSAFDPDPFTVDFTTSTDPRHWHLFTSKFDADNALSAIETLYYNRSSKCFQVFKHDLGTE